MAAFSSFHFFAPGALCQRASVVSTPRVTQRRATALAEVASLRFRERLIALTVSVIEQMGRPKYVEHAR
jgi:hypothetical protein